MSGQREQTVRQFFADAGIAALLLPDGWFGGPMENHHQLTFVTERPNRLLIELDDQLLLSFSGDIHVEQTTTTLAMAEGTPALALEGFSQFVFDWLEYGSDEPHATVYEQGRVCLIAPT